MKEIKIGSQFSGVGAFDTALKRLKIPFKNIYQAEWDKYARKTYLANNEQPEYYVEDVNDTPIEEITEKHGSMDIVMFSPPCQAFSLAGKRLGKNDPKGRGILFFNSLEFIEKNRSRFFIFENVKGLISSKNNLQYENILYLCISKFNKIETWQKLNTQKSNLNLLSQTLSPYLFMNWSRRLGLRKTKSGISFISNSELSYERLEKIAKSGLKRRLKFLEGRIYQIMKKQNYCHQEQTPQLECNEEDLILSQEKLYLIENLYRTVTNMLEKTVGINANTSLFANNILEENLKTGKLYTTLTELNSTIDKRTFMYVLEMNIIRLTTLALDLSPNLWKEIWHILTGKKEFTGLKTFDEWIYNLENVGYNLHWKVLNAKDYGVPQNRERVFIIGIRDDQDNNFTFPPEEPLTKRLKDVLESEVEEKYYLSEKMIQGFTKHAERHNEKSTGFAFKPKNENDIANCLRANAALCPTDNTIIEETKIISHSLFPRSSKTGKGGTGHLQKEDGTSYCIDTGCTQAVEIVEQKIKNKRLLETLNKYKNIDNNTIIDSYNKTIHENISPTISTRVNASNQTHLMQSKIRKLTPIECFRLMDFPDSLVENARKAGVSDSQLYRQAGNSIVVAVLEKIIKRLKL